MGHDSGPVAVVEAPPLKPLSLKSRLAPTPKNPPKYSVKVKGLGGRETVVADTRAVRALIALMDVHAVNGGAACHWGGPSAFAEIMAAVHAVMFTTSAPRQWYEAYNFTNDAGHTENGVYALRSLYGFDNMTFEDLKGFRSIKSKLTGHGEAHLNPEQVFLSNGPLGSTIPQAQGLAAADKVAGNDRVTICTISDGASMEGEAKEAFAAIPGLAAKGKMNPFVMIVSDNDTKLSGRITKDSFSMQPTFEALDDLGWHVMKVEQGHDQQRVLEAVEMAIRDAKTTPTKPVAIWVKTIKGFGVKETEQSSSGGHGFPLNNGEKIVDFINEIYGGADKVPGEFSKWAMDLRQLWETEAAKKKAVPAPASAPKAVKQEKVQAGLARAAITAAQKGLPVYSISADLPGSTGIGPFQKALPGRSMDVGVAESNMISTGAGFAKIGFIPIVDTFGQFGITKGNLPLTMAALSQAPVIAIFSHVGFQDAADGASHEATTYFATISPIPHTVVISPSCADEAESLMLQAIEKYAADRSAGKDGESYIFFVGRENYPVYWVENAKYLWEKAVVLREGKDVVLVGAGPLLNAAIEAGKKLAAEGIEATVINSPFINRVDLETIGGAVKKCGGRLVTIEDHQAVNGMGAQISHALSEAGIQHSIKTLGIHGEFGQSAYKSQELYDKHGLNTAGMVAAAKKLLGK